MGGKNWFMWGRKGKMVNLSLDLFEVPVEQAAGIVQHPIGNMSLEFTIKIRTKNVDLEDNIHSIF